MFKIHRQPQGEGAVKKSIQKLSDHKKDVGTRLKHLKIIIENSTAVELQSIFQKNYSQIYYIFFENFLLAETNLRLRGYHRAQREELDSILAVFEHILINLPDLIHNRWQYQSIDIIIKKLLHTQNSIKVRRDGVNYFLLWIRALCENALPRTLLVYACLIPGFPPPTFSDGKPYSLEWLVNMPVNEDYGVHQTEITCLVPPSSGEKQPYDTTKYFLDVVLEHMVLKAQAINWKDKEKSSLKSLSFLWDLFKKHYLPHAFEDFSYTTSIYSDEIALPEPRSPVTYRMNASNTGSLDSQLEVTYGCAMLTARVSIIKFVVAFTGSFERNDTLVIGPRSKIEALQRQVLKQLLEFTSSQTDRESDLSVPDGSVATSMTGTLPPSGESADHEAPNSNTSTLTEREPSISSLSSLDDKLQSSTTAEENLVRRVLYSTRENVNIVHELFRQAFMLPLTEVATMRRVVKVYQQWLKDGDVPIFMKSSPLDESLERRSDEENILRNTSYMRGQLKPVLDDALTADVCAGAESTYQLFITNSAYVFLVESPPSASKLIDSQIDVCNKVLKLYRHMVINIPLADSTWTQLLRVLLHVTKTMFHQIPKEAMEVRKYQPVASKLACPVFQTLIVSWIKANLFVRVSTELWNELVDVLSSSCHWEELITEWTKTMKTMTRVLSRNVYQLDVRDLPLDRLTEQKHKKQMKTGMQPLRASGALMSERSFSRGWSQDSFSHGDGPSVRANRFSRPSLQSFTAQSIDAENLHENEEKGRLRKTLSVESTRPRSSTVPNASARTGNNLPPHPEIIQSSVLSPPCDTNNSPLKRHLSASDISGIDANVNTSPRHRTGSEGPGAVSSDPVEVDAGNASNGPRVAWQEPTHQVHNYHSGSGDASESTSLSVQSIEEDDEFDALVNERLHSDSRERDKSSEESWHYEATSLDSGSIDVDWNRVVDPTSESKPQILTSSLLNTPNINITCHDDSAAASPAPAHDQTFESTGSCLTSPPYHLYENDSVHRNSSAAMLLGGSFNASEEEADESASKEAENPSQSIHSTDTGSSVEIQSTDATKADLSTPETPKQEDKNKVSRKRGMKQSDNSQIGTPASEHVMNQRNLSPDSLQSNQLSSIDEMQNESYDRSILSGGKQTGWLSENAAAIWRRLLGVLGDINEIDDPHNHLMVFNSLIEIWKTLHKIRQNIGIVSDNSTPADSQDLVPPLRIFSPWAFKAAFDLADSHKNGKLSAFQLLCNITIQRDHDVPLEEEHLAQFYALLHLHLHSNDNDIVNKIIESCAHYFPCCLPASTLLLLDFIYACHTVAASTDMKAPRVQAQIILGSTLCFPNIYHNVPVLSPDSTDPSANVYNNVKDYIVEALLTSSKKEPSAAARCVALSSTGLWLYEELTSAHQRHPRVKEAINVLLVSLKFSNRSVACVACSHLHLLTHCSDELLNTMPDMPPRIIEVMSLTVSSLYNTSEAKNSESGRQLLVSLLLCILDWCMAVPVELLTETYGVQSEKRLIRTVFKALQTAALGKPGHSAKHSYSLSDLASNDFDPNLQLDTVQGDTGGVSINRSKSSVNRSSTLPLGTNSAVSLAAHTALGHLVNHLGHFPLARGTSVLTSVVSEHHDAPDAADKLSPSLFNSPEVQFLIYNDTCLLSVIEIPSENQTPGGGVTAGLSTSDRCVRFIVRDAGGKYCWDASVLYGPPSIRESSTPVSCIPVSTLDDEIGQAAKRFCHAYAEYVGKEEQTKRVIEKTPLPCHEVPMDTNSCDKLEQMLQYIGHTSPECQIKIGVPLNIPSSPPSCLSEELENNATQCVLRHHQNLGASYEQNALASNWKCSPMLPYSTANCHTPFRHARLLCAEMGFLSRDNRHRVNLLTKNERLLRELKHLDSRKCRETHKVAVFFIAKGQEDKISILSNTSGSKEFEQFVAGLGWEVDLGTHSGFLGKLQRDGSNGATAPYYATSTLELIYHVATRFPSVNEHALNVKIQHLGNDEVHIVWSEHHRDYRRGIIPTEFGDVLIVIYPIRHSLYRVQIMKKQDIPFFGPLFDGAVVNGRVLPVLVRETVINASRAKRSLISLYQPFYEERNKYLRQIIEQFKDERTFEDYCSNLFCPVPTESKKADFRLQSTSVSSSQMDPTQFGHKSSISSQSGFNNNNNGATAPSSYPRVSTHRKPQRPPPPIVATGSSLPPSTEDHLNFDNRPKIASSSSTNLSTSSRASIATSSLLEQPYTEAGRTHRLSLFNRKSASVTFHNTRPQSKSTSSFQQQPLYTGEDILVDLRDLPTPPQSPPIEPSKVLDS